jgi:hypothetical protein
MISTSGSSRVGVRRRRARPQGLKPDSEWGSFRHDWKSCPFKSFGGTVLAGRLVNARNSMAFRSDENSNTRLISAHADAED